MNGWAFPYFRNEVEQLVKDQEYLLFMTQESNGNKIPKQDYPVKSYDSWEALFQDSDVVCVIQVSPLAADHFTAADYFCAAIKEVLCGEAETDIKLKTENIMAWDGSMRWEMLDDPWMNEGEEYLVFLKKEDGDGNYHVTGES